MNRHYIGRLIGQVVEELIPIKGMSYFQAYFRSVYLVTELKDVEKIFEINFLIWYQLLEIVRYLGLFLKIIPYEKMDRIVWYDCCYLFGLKNSGNLMALMMHLMVIYFCYSMYFKGNHSTNRLLYQVLIERRTTFFVQPYIRDRPVTKVVRLFSLFFFSIFQVFVLAIGKLVEFLIHSHPQELFSFQTHSCSPPST